ncbi:MAG TPA: hypothetical protein VI874_04210 [Candidatus Norongarragalinales archaeon]|nr:hypothetical protein [Candidatus Norongarragalinales archaeon]
MEDAVYQKLVEKSVKEKVSAKRMSETLNETLKNTFAREEVPKSRFGAWKHDPISTEGLRDEGEPH